MRSTLLVLGALFLAGLVSPASAQSFNSQFDEMVKRQFRVWVNDPTIVGAVKAQNIWSSNLSLDEIKAMDQSWRLEAPDGQGPTIDPVLNNPASDFLRARKKEGEGRFAEIFVMDARGLNVATSDVTSDFWQGDEDKWRQTFPVGAGAVFYDSLEFDASTEVFQTQISVTIADPASGEPIGAMTVGVSFASDAVDKLAYGEHLSSECGVCHQVQPGTVSRSRVGVPQIIDLPINVFEERMAAQTSSRSFEMRDIATTISPLEMEALAIFLSTVKPE